MTQILAIITAITTLFGAALGVLKYFQYRTRRDKIMLVRQSFDTVVKSLASSDEIERSSGAILLRRFFDQNTEVGIAGRPYWKEALDVIAAILRSVPPGNFQKLLADGLAFAPHLIRADLQRTNLQFAYLGSRFKIGSHAGNIPTDLSFADFYRADLSKASLKNAKAHGCVFYQARMHETVLSGADLTGANFFDADLRGAIFKGAILFNANFKFARNLPPSLLAKLNDSGIYTEKEPFKSQEQLSKEPSIHVFISKPAALPYDHQQAVHSMESRLKAEGMIPQTLERKDYPQFGAIFEIQRIMDGCAGAVIFGFKQLEVLDGVFRSSTPEAKPVKGIYLSTPWNQIEAGMAVTLQLPILIVCERGVDEGIFNTDLTGNQMYRVFLDDKLDEDTCLTSLSNWFADVRERSRS